MLLYLYRYSPCMRRVDQAGELTDKLFQNNLAFSKHGRSGGESFTNPKGFFCGENMSFMIFFGFFWLRIGNLRATSLGSTGQIDLRIQT